MRIEIPFVGPTFSGRSGKMIGSQTVNLYPQTEAPGAKHIIGLYSDPGLLEKFTAGLGPCRSNGVVWKNRLYFVSGASLISIDVNENVTVVGTLNTTGGRVSIAAGRTYLGLVDGTNGYSWNGTTFAQISDADFLNGATHITWLDTFFIVNSPASDQFFISASDDVTSWVALDFASAESSPDDILAHIANEKDLYLCGAQTTEVFYNSGNPDFPLEVYPNGVLEFGIAAPHSLAKSALGLYWLAIAEEGDPGVVHVDGFSPKVISNNYVEWQIGKMSTISDAIGHVYKHRQHWFYQLTFPSEDKTFVYAIKEGQWFDRKSYGIGRHRVNGHGFFNRKQYVGTYNTAKFYELDFDTYTDAGNPIERIRRAQVIHKTGRTMVFNELVIDMQTGVGNTVAPGDDPEVMLRFSDDGAKTWSNILTTKLGKIGKYDTGVAFYKLGESRERIFELKVTDPVEVNIFGAYADIDLLDY